ncbi:MAG: hypothetical protein RRC34_16350 [Lentisphaeria bacterium]|nr:hypothetical protein [Lentisphaeria bacterium]
MRKAGIHCLFFLACAVMCSFLLSCRMNRGAGQDDAGIQTRVQLGKVYTQIPDDIKTYGGSVYQYGKWRDGWGNDFRVKTQKKGEHIWYEVRSSGPDGRFDTEDDIFRASGPEPRNRN